VTVSPNEGGDVQVSGFGLQTEASKVYGGCSPVADTVLTALPARGYEFDRWSGSISGSDTPVTIVVNTSKSVTAYFIARPDSDGDGYCVDEDCDDHNSKIHPGASEICGDGIDNDCDNTIDDGCPLNPPTSLTLKAKSSSQIVLGWKDKSTIEDGYKIERKTGGCSSTDSWKQIADIDENETTYTASGLKPGTTYAFRVRAHRSYWTNSDYSNCASTKTGASGTPPSPTNLKATSVSSTKVNLTWKDNSSNETGFKIYRKAGTGTEAWALLTETGPDVKSFSDTTAENNSSTTTYQYYVIAFNESGNSPSTFTATVPYSPINLTAAPGADTGTIKLTWTDKSGNENGFEIYRKSGKCSSTAKWIKVATIGANKKTWTDKWLTSGNEYSYQIRAYKKTGTMLSAYGYSMYGNCSSVKAP
jgi:hypothetical protein